MPVYSELEGKNVIVTGAGGGIGGAVVRGLLEQGAVPIMVDLKPEEDWEVVVDDDLSSYTDGKDYYLIEGNASKERVMEKALKPFTEVLGLVNNAGHLGLDSAHGGRTRRAADKLMESHYHSARVMTNIVTDKMSSKGSIVFMGSMELPMPDHNVWAYVPAKGAMLGLARAAAVDLAPEVRVNTVVPGRVATKANNAQEDPKDVERFHQRTPLKRSVLPEEVAHTVLFLLSDASSGITGAEIMVTGGYELTLRD